MKMPPDWHGNVLWAELWANMWILGLSGKVLLKLHQQITAENANSKQRMPSCLHQNTTSLEVLQLLASFLVSSPLWVVASATAIFLVLYTLLYLGRFSQGWGCARQNTFTSWHNHWLYFTYNVVKLITYYFFILKYPCCSVKLDICETNPNKCVYFFMEG